MKFILDLGNILQTIYKGLRNSNYFTYLINKITVTGGYIVCAKSGMANKLFEPRPMDGEHLRWGLGIIVPRDARVSRPRETRESPLNTSNCGLVDFRWLLSLVL